MGKIADIFINNYAPRDFVMIKGRLVSGGDEHGGYFTRIQLQDIEKIYGGQNDII